MSTVGQPAASQIHFDQIRHDTTGGTIPWEAHRADSHAIAVLGRGPDVAEGVESFLEKRAPHFPARVTDYLDVVPDWPARPAELT